MGDQIERYLRQLSLLQIFLCLFVMGFLAYGQTVFYPFVHDDVVFIQKNPNIHDLNNLPAIFLKSDIPRPDFTIVNTYYRPLLEVIYRLEYRFFGAHSQGYHLVNVLLHITNGFLLYFLLFLLKYPKVVAFAVSAFFLIHPVQTESVAYISGISDLTYVFFCLLSFILYVQSAQPHRVRTNLVLYVGSLFFFWIGLLTKEQSVVLPLLIILYECCWKSLPGVTDFSKSNGSQYWPPLPQNNQGNIAITYTEACSIRLLRFSGVLITIGGYFAVRTFVLPQAVPPILENPQEFALRLWALPKIFLMYLRIVVLPVDLHFYRTTDILEKSWLPGIGLVLTLLAAWRVLQTVKGEERRRLFFGIGWFFMALLPTVNIVPIFEEYSFIWTVDHFLYLPVSGLLLFIMGAIYCYLKESQPQKNSSVAVGMFVLVGLILFLMTIRYNGYWRNEIVLFKRAVEFEGRLGRVHRLLAQAYYFKGEFVKASEHYTIALNIMKQYLRLVKDPKAKIFYAGFVKGLHFDIAHCYEARQDTPTAIAHYQEALTVDPRDSVLYNSLGTQYLRLGDGKMAMQQFQKALEFSPNNLMAMSNLAVCYIQQGDRSEAEQLLKRVLEIDSRFISARQNLEKLRESN